MSLSGPDKQKIIGMIAEALNNCDIGNEVLLSFNEMSLDKGTGRVGRIPGDRYRGERYVRAWAINEQIEVRMTVYLSDEAMETIGANMGVIPEVCDMIREVDNPYVQAALDYGWTPCLHVLWNLFLEFRRKADEAAGVPTEDIRMPYDLGEALELINRTFRCIDYAAERWLHTNYPRDHAELFEHTAGSFFRAVRLFGG